MSEGKKYDEGKLRMDLVPIEAIDGIARVLGMGAKKYGDRNWERGINYSRVYAALFRHLTSWWSGEDLDPESGFNHLDHILCNAAFLRAYTMREMDEFDDRTKPVQPFEEVVDWMDLTKGVSTEFDVELEKFLNEDTGE